MAEKGAEQTLRTVMITRKDDDLEFRDVEPNLYPEEGVSYSTSAPISSNKWRFAMPADLSYMPSVANLSGILDKIRNAATPPKFTHDFLKANLGFGSSNDRSVIKILKAMNFLANDGTPTELYNEFRGSSPGVALAKGIRRGYAPLFLSDEKIYTKSGSELLGIVKNATGAGDAVAKKIATTFRSLAEYAD